MYDTSIKRLWKGKIYEGMNKKNDKSIISKVKDSHKI